MSGSMLGKRLGKFRHMPLEVGALAKHLGQHNPTARQRPWPSAYCDVPCILPAAQIK
jgi:hypothetical protein